MENYNRLINKFKIFHNSHAYAIRCLFIIITMIALNIYFVLSDFFEENNVLTDISQVIMKYSSIIFIITVGFVLCYGTYINRSSAGKVSFGILESYFAVFDEARFIIKQDFDKCFWIILVVVIILHSIPDFAKSTHKKQKTGSKNSYAPITNDANLFKSRKSQQNYLFNLIKENDFSDEGLSICITGKWGSGKTSFVNTTLDRLNANNIKFEEIRINALELEETSELIKYYFTRIKEILKNNNIYIGIKSEYKSLMNSLIDSATTEGISDIIMSCFEEKEDYRNMIAKISELLNDALPDSRIIIVVDDIERCSNNKIKQLLFFIKEVATMKKCVSLFLVDKVKLFESICLEDDTKTAEEFVDKFFDEAISLKAISIQENIERFKDVRFEELIISFLEYYDKEIDEIHNYTNQRDNDREEKRKKKLEDVITKERMMRNTFSNPRRIKKIYNFYNQYCCDITKIVKSVEGEQLKKKEFTQFLSNIEFEKQILIIAILRDTFNEQYNKIVNEGIDSIGLHLPPECWLNGIIVEEWFPLVPNYFTYYKNIFTDTLVKNNYKEILKMVDPFSNEYDKYKNSISQGKIPKRNDTDISLLNCFEVLHTKNRYDSDLIKKMFVIYKPIVTFDEALSVLDSNSIALAREIAITEFAEIFCTPDYKINNVEICRKRFEMIYPRILWKLLLDYKAYFCYFDFHLDENVEETVFNKSSFDKSINLYVSKVCSTFNYTLKKSNPIDKLREILENVKKSYSSKGYTVDAKDFENLMKHSTSAIERIEALARIDSFINSSSQSSLSIQNTITDEIKKISDIIKIQKDNNKMYLDYNGFEEFLKKIEQDGLSPGERGKYINMVEELSEIDLRYSVQARKMLFKLDSSVDNTNQS